MTPVVRSNVKAVVLDVRGTLTHPFLDDPMSLETAQLIYDLLLTDCIVALVTATSIDSVERLVINPLIDNRQSVNPKVESQFVMYVDSSTAAYSLTVNKEIVPLSDYSFLTFSDDELDVVLACIEKANRYFRITNATHKIKCGQVNYYCGGSWKERICIAEFINDALGRATNSRLAAMVPSAKATIDVPVCLKDRGVLDLRNRFGLFGEELLIIGDSLQEGGPDLDMLRAAPGAICVQVGDHLPDCVVYHLNGMPATDAVHDLLDQVLKMRNVVVSDNEL